MKGKKKSKKLIERESSVKLTIDLHAKTKTYRKKHRIFYDFQIDNFLGHKTKMCELNFIKFKTSSQKTQRRKCENKP